MKCPSVVMASYTFTFARFFEGAFWCARNLKAVQT